MVVQGIDDPTILEAMACREALSLALDINLSKIKVASDCEYKGKFSSVITEIKSRSAPFEVVFFAHERRTSNMEAHGLARSSVSLEFGRHV
jgi:hypothetical protein